ncbi:MAG: penicillin-binding protein 1A, partial [Moraxellaceae bacterium]
MAMIAGLPKAPSAFNPVNNPKRALIRRDWILERMLGLGYISQADYETAVKAPVGLNFRVAFSEVNAPWLAEMVREALVERFGEDIYLSGYKVYTTVDSARQNAASQAVIDGLLAYDRRHGWRGPEARAQESLGRRFPVGGLQPALVTTVTDAGATAVLRNGTEVSVPWETMTWARPYINVNRIGPAPKKPADLLAPGDIIRLRESAGGKWALVQVPAVQGQLVALNRDSGAIEALVGGFDYTTSKFNRVTQGWRQAGSTIKPFIYSLALEAGYTPASLINDAPLTFGEGANAWRPNNSDGEFLGPMRLRRALYMSRNTVSIRLLQAVGVNPARQYLGRFGFPLERMEQNLTLALGSAEVVPLQMAAGYAAIANGGYHVTPWFIERVEDGKGTVLFQANPKRVCRPCEAPPPATEEAPAPAELTGEGSALAVLEPPPPPMPYVPDYPVAERIMSARAAWQMQSILRDVVLRGTGRAALSLGRGDLGGKTGTTNDAKDAWFGGFGGDLVAVSWVGFDQPQTLGRMEYGGFAALPLWNGFMGPALKGVPEYQPPMPSGLVAVRVRLDNGQRTTDDDPNSYVDYLQEEKLPAAPPAGPESDAGPQVSPDDLF